MRKTYGQERSFQISVAVKYGKSPTYEPSSCKLSKVLTCVHMSNHISQFYFRRHCYFLRHKTRIQNGTRRLEQHVFRMQSSATMSSMMRNKELVPRHHWIIFSRGQIELNTIRNQNLCHQHQEGVKFQLALCLLLLMILQLYHLPPHLPPPVSNSSCLCT